MPSRLPCILACGWLCIPVGFASVFGTIQGVVHDPQHRPVPGASITLNAVASDWTRSIVTDQEGTFLISAVPVGEYHAIVSFPGFAVSKQAIEVQSGSVPVLHFQLKLETRQEVVEVSESSDAIGAQKITPTTLVSREEIALTPGADLTNSMSMIANYTPGAYMTHDQLHIHGGHQVTWAIDGVPIPNTNIASNVGPQIDPKDIDYLETQRGGYSAEIGDRTYGVFNVVPRTGFEKNREIEINTSYGTFHQTNDQINFGNHTDRFAWFGSVNGNRSDYGLSTPGPDILHDRVWGLGGFGSLIFNADASNQFRLISSLRRDDYQIPNDPAAQDAGIRDVERERDAVVAFTWAHSYSPGVLLAVSPFMHFNRADYDGGPNDTPVSTVQHLDSTYAGAQASLNAIVGRHDARIGFYGFGQHDGQHVRLTANDGSGNHVVADQIATGQLEAGFLEDQFKPTGWLTLTGGLRLTHFSGAISESAADPRLGAAIQIPHLNWVIRGFYGRYYQAPPLSTVSGPLLDFAVAQGFGFIPLKGERDEENQVGLTIPIRGWAFDLNNFRLRARNYFDHNAIGNSNVFFPLSLAGARIYGTELVLRSPRLFQRGEVVVVYSHQHAEGQGPVTGGLTDFSPPPNGYFNLDHDQRNTLHTNFNWNLPRHIWAAGNVYYGSGFSDGDNPGAHLEPHTTFDLSLGTHLRESVSISITALNLFNRRYLEDNSETFGGTHYAGPRQIYVQLRYRFHY
jgi:hypothetical protein